MIESLYEKFRLCSSVCTDSRAITEGCIFFALKGENFNGNAFAKEALDKGAKYVVVDEQVGSDDKIIFVENVLSTLQQLATYHRKKFSIPIVAITGSNGKTTTKELVKSVLEEKFKTHATTGNLNNHIGVPLTLLSLMDDIEIAVIEMGANHIGEIDALCKIALPTHGLITNVGKAHLEGFGSFEGVIKAKSELYNFLVRNSGFIFCNLNNEFLPSLINGYDKICFYGKDKSAILSGEIISEELFLKIKWQHKNETYEVQSQLVGAYNFENILAAIAIGCFFEVEATKINNAIAGYVPRNQRSQVIHKGSNTIVLDAYNANPTSMEQALINFNKNFRSNRLVMLGDMFELGDSEEAEHLAIINLLKEFSFDKVLLVGKRFSRHRQFIDALFFDNSNEASEYLKKNSVENTSILIKGSRSSRMEVLLDAL